MGAERLAAGAAAAASGAAAVRRARRRKEPRGALGRAARADRGEPGAPAPAGGGGAATAAGAEAVLGVALVALSAAVLTAGGAAALRAFFPGLRPRKRPPAKRAGPGDRGRRRAGAGAGGGSADEERAHWFQVLELAHRAAAAPRGGASEATAGARVGSGGVPPLPTRAGGRGGAGGAPSRGSEWRVPAALGAASVALWAASRTDPSAFPALHGARVPPGLASQICALLLVWYVLIQRLVRNARPAAPAPAPPQRPRAEAAGPAPAPTGAPLTADAGAHPPGVQGRWLKDRTASDPMDAACDLVRMHYLVRQGVRLVKGMAFQVTPRQLCLQVFSEIPVLKIRERYPLVPGETSQNRRRDMRLGGVRASGRARGTHYELRYEFGAPYGGVGTDLVVPVGPQELHVYSVVAVAGREVFYRQVYRRPPTVAP